MVEKFFVRLFQEDPLFARYPDQKFFYDWFFCVLFFWEIIFWEKIFKFQDRISRNWKMDSVFVRWCFLIFPIMIFRAIFPRPNFRLPITPFFNQKIVSPHSGEPIFFQKNLGIKELEIGYPSVAWQNLLLWHKEILTTALQTQRDINKEKKWVRVQSYFFFTLYCKYSIIWV